MAIRADNGQAMTAARQPTDADRERAIQDAHAVLWRHGEALENGADCGCKECNMARVLLAIHGDCEAYRKTMDAVEAAAKEDAAKIVSLGESEKRLRDIVRQADYWLKEETPNEINLLVRRAYLSPADDGRKEKAR